MNFDIIIPHSSSDRYRERNLKYILEYYGKNVPDVNIVLVEQGTKTDISHIAISNITHLGIEFDEEPELFRKSILINEGVKQARTDLIVMADNDCILYVDILNSLKEKMGDADYFVPFTDINFLNEGHTRQLVRDGKFVQANQSQIMHSNRYTGGVIVFKKELFSKVGGFEEEMKGWGKEDDVFLEKCRRVGGKIERIQEKSTLLHIFHPKSDTKEYLKSPRFMFNGKALALIKRMSDKDLQYYIENKYKETNELFYKLFFKYESLRKLETNITIKCGDGMVDFDISIYNIIPDQNGNVGLEELMNAIYTDDGDKTVSFTIYAIRQKCKNLSRKEKNILEKYENMINITSS